MDRIKPPRWIMHEIALSLLEAGIATPNEIAALFDLRSDTVQTWCRRAGIDTKAKRLEIVRKAILKYCDDDDKMRHLYGKEAAKRAALDATKQIQWDELQNSDSGRR